jgi:hypothetical protein
VTRSASHQTCGLTQLPGMIDPVDEKLGTYPQGKIENIRF